jgi:hypothetical protein
MYVVELIDTVKLAPSATQEYGFTATLRGGYSAVSTFGASYFDGSSCRGNTMPDNDENSDDPGYPADVAACSRILNDTIGHLASRFGVDAVVSALTEIVGCQLCISEAARGAGIRGLAERMRPAPGSGDPDDESIE